MERAALELERRSRYLSSLIQQQKKRNDGDCGAAAKVGEKGEAKVPWEEEVVVVVKEQKEVEAAKDYVAREPAKGEKQRKGDGDVGRGGGEAGPGQQRQVNVRVRAADMPPELQKHAFRCAQQLLTGMPRLDSKRLALNLKKIPTSIIRHLRLNRYIVAAKVSRGKFCLRTCGELGNVYHVTRMSSNFSWLADGAKK
ncbi:hypothetical protein Taro_008655 [Colocasia esculenta]|uniref:Dynein light chain n=1 Tax=Colocasia esculenta TaxID=4460 RepID=A0A843U2G8_COLES|nr:hypothetical protein [Colocasia esculenta]